MPGLTTVTPTTIMRARATENTRASKPSLDRREAKIVVETEGRPFGVAAVFLSTVDLFEFGNPYYILLFGERIYIFALLAILLAAVRLTHSYFLKNLGHLHQVIQFSEVFMRH